MMDVLTALDGVERILLAMEQHIGVEAAAPIVLEYERRMQGLNGATKAEVLIELCCRMFDEAGVLRISGERPGACR